MDGELSIGQVARESGVSASAIRYYERQGLLKEPRRDSGWRRYQAGVLDRLSLIVLATRSGFSLVEVRVLLDSMDQGAAPSAELGSLALNKLPEMRATLARTQLLIDLMQAAVSCGCPDLKECARRAREAGV